MTNEDNDKLDEETRRIVDEVDDAIGDSEPDEDDPTDLEEMDDDFAFSWENEEDEDREGTSTTEERDQSDPTPVSGESTAERIWGMIFGVFSTITWGLIFAALSKMPGRKRIYIKMIRGGYQGFYKNTGAHVIVNTIYGDREVVPRPAEIDKEENKVKTDNGEEWTLADGIQTYHVGDARVMWGVADDHELVSPIAARTAEKLDLEDAVYVQRQNQRRGTPSAAHNPQGQPAQNAVADGGVSATGLYASSLDRWNGEPFEDVFVNWANTNPDAEGMIVSLEKAYEMHHSQAGAEEMKKQEIRGRLSERFDGNKKTAMMYVLLLLGGILLGLFGPALAASIAGTDGGGSTVSLMLTPLLGW